MRKYLRAANVGWGGLLLGDVKRMNFTDAEMAVFRLEPGDLLLNEASGSPLEVGKPALWQGEIEDCAFQNTLLRVRPGPEIDPRYLLHFFRYEAATGAFARGSRGVGIRHLGRAALSEWSVPICSIDEQRRIAAILDQVDALRFKRRRVIAQLDALASSIFTEMFGDPVENERGWDVVDLRDVVTKIDNGTSPVCEARPARGDEWAVLKLGAISYGVFNSNENKAFLGDRATIRCVEVTQGDLLFSRKNTKELVGATVVVHDVPPRRLLPDLIFRIELKRERVVADYMHALLRNPRKRSQVVALASGSASSMSNISKSRLLGLQIELPPTELQQIHSERIRGVLTQRAQYEQARQKLDALFASLQSRAFRGEL